MPTRAPEQQRVTRNARKTNQAKSGPVTTRKLVPTVTQPALVTPDEQLVVASEAAPPYYPPVPQIEGRVPYKYSTRLITPEQARKMILDADSDPEFHQRRTAERDIRRWKLLMETNQFVDYLPDGPLLFDPDGMLMNGKHRLTANSRQTKPHGFVIISNVPRWMFPFFDTGKARTLNHVFDVAGKATKGQTGPAMRLGMRFIEVLRGERDPIGWQNWTSVSDEHFNVLGFRTAHDEMVDLYKTAVAVSRASKLNVHALMVWRYFQQVAWPTLECEQKIDEFWEQLRTGAIARTSSPVLRFREWSKEVQEERQQIRGKRELHLILLNRIFELYCQGDSLGRLTWAHGWPMNTPYHPKPGGHDAAVKNVLAYCDKMGIQT